ncbi:nucleoside phosphorylase [Brevibacillus humidisoli]|uniref:nucleoside phosphorylase n=1 Tax=Brevibacillus humidisoli TaxID=2895522 RepID=UPI001E35673C|nr:nucleoside phosphorylase [Brevibacillus humidisoli]UFJ39492.1 nucleoside phosphorylase [Brevibacillus humidisoli]
MLLSILRVNPEEIPAQAIVCGDPHRAAVIADYLENSRELAFSREYRTFVGEYKGVPLAVVSHGVGSPGAAVCFEELIRAGVTTLVRVGTAGSLTGELPPGSLAISTAAVREEGLTRQYVPQGFPAVADSTVVEALYTSAREREGVVRKGITLTLDAFFRGVVELPHKTYQQAGVIAVEMETAALFVIASLRGVRAGSILAIDGYADVDLAQEYNPHTDEVAKAVAREIEITLEAFRRLSSQEA